MIHYYSIFYFCISLLFKKYERIEIESLIHCFLSLFLSINLFKKYFSYKIFATVKLPRDIFYLSQKDPDFKQSLIDVNNHSIGYFVSDIFYSIVKKDSTYIPHHLLSILCLYNNPSTTSGLFYAELGGFFHHLKRFKYYFPKNISILISILYFLGYGYSRILFFCNLTDYMLYSEKDSYFAYIQVILTYMIIYQNMLWLYKNYLNFKK